jgi:alkanesulfonate monooxygenase SsuD/methylene tetrahydromethanopterin reductase-like flavin-dependent oxidoreductase (luciferase family)
VLPRIWTQEEISYDGTYYQIPRREILPKPVQQPHRAAATRRRA